ncbi:hypothetical protein [Candidatus Tisiphia endosymbiont of Ditula angustiorana]|uniref:hypothetical protein n=1 Tax=Candidatus Tisiphia endosymbiont of Ditula angustiorana TaxID=3066272 RepID=UPI00312C83C8
MLAPKQKGDERTITVYPSATGTKKAEYIAQDGTIYRELQYNSRKGYNDNAIFRSELSDEATKNVLKTKIVNHVIISLLPFHGLEIGCIFDDEGQCKNTTILQALCELTKVNYESEGINLDDTWMINVQDECSRYFSEALGNVSQPTEVNYDL